MHWGAPLAHARRWELMLEMCFAVSSHNGSDFKLQPWNPAGFPCGAASSQAGSAGCGQGCVTPLPGCSLG